MTDLGPMVVSLGACKAFLRLDGDGEDALLSGLIRTAAALCEAFTGQWLIIRSGDQRLAAESGWQRLLMAPVVTVTGVGGAASFESDVDVAGTGWVRVSGALAQPVANVRAGLAEDWNGIPEPLRQGIIRLVAHLYTHRDAADAGPPPTAVAAMWRPWRRLRIGGS